MAKASKAKPRADGIRVYCSHDKIVPLTDLKPNPENPNTHPAEQIDLLAEIIKGNGWRDRITVSNLSGLIVKGHGRYMAAVKAGLAEAPVDFQDYDNAVDEIADLIADNKISELSKVDNKLAREMMLNLDDFDLGDMPTLGRFGFNDDEIFKIFPEMSQGDSPDDEVPEVDEKDVVTKPGDLYLLGRHRLLCGDATVKADVERLMDGKKADMVLTDPPYGIGYAGSMKLGQKKFGWKQYKGGWDEKRPRDETILMISNFAEQAIIWGANFFNCLPVSSGWLVWNKVQRNFSMGEGELAWTNINNSIRVYDLSRAGALSDGKVHPTQKPISLMEWCLSFLEGSSVVDFYLGSGSTLIACEKTNRICYGMEIEPYYCDVIVRRWQDYTGQTATLEGA